MFSHAAVNLLGGLGISGPMFLPGGLGVWVLGYPGGGDSGI